MLLLVKKLDADQGKIKIHLVWAVGDANSTVPETRRHPIRSDDRPKSNISIAVAKTGFIEIAEAARGVLDPSFKDGGQADYVST